jgi:hypothetical protein
MFGQPCEALVALQRCRHNRERRFTLDLQTVLDQTLDEFLGMHGVVRLTQHLIGRFRNALPGILTPVLKECHVIDP